MPLDISQWDDYAADATHLFWNAREQARQRQVESGVVDQGERAGVTAGKNMDGFVRMIARLVEMNGLDGAKVYTSKSLVTLPGYFRATKDWDLLVLHGGRLIAAIELKSQVGPSFGNNFNNRAEEAIGTAHDLWTAFREGAFGDQPRPFVGWLVLVEDAPASRRPGQREASRHFAAFPEFKKASYLERYNILCQRLVKEQLYTEAALITSTREDGVKGRFGSMSDETSLKRFVAAFSGHIAAAAI